ncbi:MAG: beta-lactamase family protein [Microthrixaceae bacterium]|nr:beta-lactamase family protein [Microthrixaceae bacterium]
MTDGASPSDPAPQPDVATQVLAAPFEELVDRLDREAAEGLFHTAAQLVVEVSGETVLDVAVGRTHRHEPFRTDTLSALYCTAKPVVAVAVLALVADDELSLTDQLHDVVADLEVPWIADRTVEEVLAHTAGLHTVNTVLARILPESMREPWMYVMPPPVGWRFGIDRAYAEFGGWFLLGKVIEEIGEAPFADFVGERVLAPYGVEPRDLVMRFDADTFAAEVPRISATFDLTLDAPVPLLAEVGPDTACEWNPAFGAYGTIGAMAVFYRGLLDDLAGANRVLPADLLGEATRARLPLTEDVTLGRPAGFGLGFMTPLSSHHFGDRPSEEAFGHAGQGGTSFAMADPERDLVVAVLFNAGLDADTALSYRRVNLVDAIYRGVDQLG